MDSVPSELVIVDTGSTDKTVEIAKAFTDKVFDFAWINDFSAARNFGLEKCTGKWFMYLDADEIFDKDLSGLISFFNDKAALKKHNSATYFIKNYNTPDGSEWSEFTAARIVKRSRELRFINPIHEGFSVFAEPVMSLKTTAHHWGYAYETDEEREAKNQRNLSLLQGEVSGNPNDLRASVQMLASLGCSEREALFPELLEKAKKLSNDFWLPVVLTFITLHYYMYDNHEKALYYNNEFFKAFGNKPKSVLFLDMYVTKGVLLKNKEKYAEAVEAFENYFKLFDLYTAGKLNTEAMAVISLTCYAPHEREKIMQLSDGIKAELAKRENLTASVLSQLKQNKKQNKKIILSVSMIVKNEEKMLGGCLECLKPLLDAVPSELVIIDTGSTDKTVKIAKHFTDKVYDYKWNDDFGAARNFGLEKCTGEWFMYLDADEHFADVSDLIKFFSDEKIHAKHNTGYFTIHNFATAGYDEYFSFFAHRISRRTESLRFVGAIHEALSELSPPAYYFESYANHYGYAFENEEQRRKKSARNLILLEKELAKNPDDLRTISHVIGSMPDPDEKKRALIERAVELSDKSDELIAFAAYFKAFELYSEAGEVEKALAVLEKVQKKAKAAFPKSAVLAEMYACKGFLLYNAGRFAESEEALKSYLGELDKLEKGKLDKSVFVYMVANYTAPEKRDAFVNLLALCINAQNRADEALAVYNDSDFAALPPAVFIKTTETISIIAKNKAAHKGLISIYERILKTENEDKTALFEKMLETLYFSDRAFAESFKEAKAGKFAELMRFAAMEDPAVLLLEKFIDSFEPLPEGYSAAVELALTYNANLSGAIAKMNLEHIREHLAVIAKNNSGLPMLALKYRDDNFYVASIKNLLFGALLFEAACYEADRLVDLQKAEVYGGCIKYCSLYVSNAYNPDLLNEDDIGALPEAHRFGYFMGAAQKLLDEGNKLGYIRELKKALTSCKSMQKIIKFQIEEFSKTL
jgi:glycosyltransferase involved in cell wall biosynthesis